VYGKKRTGSTRHQSMLPRGTSSAAAYNGRNNPGHDGNLYTGRSKVRERDILGNYRSARRPSSLPGCFITTACVEARGLSEGCYELSLLRMFRREYVEKLPDGQEVLAEYREKAPRIVAAIRALPPVEALAVWEDLYERGVRPAVSLITSGAWDAAFAIYRGMCAELEERYLPGEGAK
jgi:hypothetical protein